VTQDISIVALFCEDVREEKAGTYTIIGIFPDNLNFPKLPAALPKLGIYARVHMRPSFDPGPIEVHLVMPDGTVAAKVDLTAELVKQTRDAALASSAPIAGLIAHFIISPLHVRGPGRIQVVAHFSGNDYVCGNLYVNEQPKAA
jgi:hypothetical protein